MRNLYSNKSFLHQKEGQQKEDGECKVGHSHLDETVSFEWYTTVCLLCNIKWLEELA